MTETDEAARLTKKGRATKERIVSAAADLIFEYGVAGTSIEDVRRAAGVSGSQMAHYFHDKRRLVIDLEQNAVDIVRFKASLDQAIRIREEALVRSPIDGIVTQINSRQGEMASPLGLARVVDMKQLRVFATVDELHLPRLKVGAPVEVTFRGSPTVYKGKIAIAPMTVKREKRSEADLGVASVRQIEVEIRDDTIWALGYHP